MISTLISLLAMSPAPVVADTKTYISQPHGVSMEVPTNWKISKDKVKQRFTMPSGAYVDVFETNFQKTGDEWQGLQKQVNEDMKRTVDRQWDEEILGVPLLMTSVLYSDRKLGDQGLLIGILFSNTANKFHFRLQSPRPAFSDSEAAWRGVLATMRPVDGVLPTPEDGITNAPIKPADRPVVTQAVSLAPTGPKTNALGPVKVPFSAANRPGVLRLPKGWDVAGTGPFTVKHQKMGFEFKLEVFSSLDSPIPGVALMKMVDSDLDKLTQVEMRENIGPKANAIGIQTIAIFRTGAVSGNAIMQFYGAADGAANYYILSGTYGDKSKFKAVKKELLTFINATGFEPEPK